MNFIISTIIIIVVGALISAAVNRRAKRRNPITVLSSGEVIVKRGAANLQRNAETVGGFLYLTDRRLIFESHKVNIQRGVTEVNLRNISGITTGWTKFLGLIPVSPNALLVKIQNGTEYRLTLWGKNSWNEAIKHAVTTAVDRQEQ